MLCSDDEGMEAVAYLCGIVGWCFVGKNVSFIMCIVVIKQSVSKSGISNFYLSKYIHKSRMYPGIFRIYP
jgi:hypothetical protein